MKTPDNITLCNLECVVLPNGEVISCGITVGRIKDFGDSLKPKIKE